jgi:RNA polymerase-binding transcription factor DksA
VAKKSAKKSTTKKTTKVSAKPAKAKATTKKTTAAKKPAAKKAAPKKASRPKAAAKPATKAAAKPAAKKAEAKPAAPVRQESAPKKEAPKKKAPASTHKPVPAAPKARPEDKVSGDQLLSQIGFGKKIMQKKPIVEVSRGKDPIELHHRPLTKRELADLRVALLKRLADLTEDVEQLEAEVHEAEESSSTSKDVVETSSAQYEQDFMLQRMESESEDLANVKRALAKLDGKLKGHTYGQCEATGLWISIERLRAKPEARLCVAAVEKFEREGGGEEYGVPLIRR